MFYVLVSRYLGISVSRFFLLVCCPSIFCSSYGFLEHLLCSRFLSIFMLLPYFSEWSCCSLIDEDFCSSHLNGWTFWLLLFAMRFLLHYLFFLISVIFLFYSNFHSTIYSIGLFVYSKCTNYSFIQLFFNYEVYYYEVLWEFLIYHRFFLLFVRILLFLSSCFYVKIYLHELFKFLFFIDCVLFRTLLLLVIIVFLYLEFYSIIHKIILFYKYFH